jgi:membrane protein
MRADRDSRSLVHVVTAAARDFSKDQCGLRAAGLSYYTIFALPPLLILLIKIAGAIWNPQQVQATLESQFSGMVGGGGATTVSQMVSSGQHTGHGTIATILSVVGLLLGATGAFLSLQNALNAAWEVGPDPKQGGIKSMIARRLLSLGMVMGLAFLLIVSLAVSAALGALGKAIGNAGIVMQIVNIVISLVILAVLFAAIFKFLPDATIRWRTVWIGGIATAVLFEIGKFLIGLYLGHSKPGNAFGAASALAVILVWLYYAGMIVLFGAEFTQQFAKSRGHGVRPKKGAVCINRDERLVRADGTEKRYDDTSPTNDGAADANRDNQPDTARKPARSAVNRNRLLPVPPATDSASTFATDGQRAEASSRMTLMVVAALTAKRMIAAFKSRK